jgi:hypothetical protein
MWARRIARRLGWTRNPLRRTSDRIEAWSTAALIVVILSIGPWAAMHAATTAYRHDIKMNAYERAHRFPVQAVLLADATWHVDATDAGQAAPETVPVLVSWSWQNGVVKTGTGFAPVGQRSGSTVRIWVDDHGARSVEPAQRSPRTDATVAVALVVCVASAGFAGIRQIVRWLLDRRRLRSWQAEWRVVERRWSSR